MTHNSISHRNQRVVLRPLASQQSRLLKQTTGLCNMKWQICRGIPNTNLDIEQQVPHLQQKMFENPFSYQLMRADTLSTINLKRQTYIGNH